MGAVDINFQVRNSLSKIERYQTALEKVRDEKMEMERTLETLEEFKTSDVGALAAVTSAFTGDQVKKTRLEQYLEQLVELRLDESRLSVKYTDDHMEIKKIKQQIQALNVFVESEIQGSIDIKRKQLDIVISREENLMELMAALIDESTTYPEKGVELHRIERTLGILEKRLDLLQQQHLSSRINMASNPDWSVTILAPAARAYQKKTRDYVRMALGPIFSLIIALGFAFFMNNLDHSIKNVSEAEDALGFQVLSSFPDLDSK